MHHPDGFLRVGLFLQQALDGTKRPFDAHKPHRELTRDALAAVGTWVEDVLRVGRRSGAVRDDLPEALQAHLVFRILQVFDEWTVAHFDEIPTSDLGALANAQFATIRRMLER